MNAHDVERHFYPQVLGFINALKNETTKRRIKELMYNNIKQNPISLKKIRTALPIDGEIYHFLETTLNKAWYHYGSRKENSGIGRNNDSISTNMNLQSGILEFIAFVAAPCRISFYE